MSKQKATILVNSCDLYKDAWGPFFLLLSIQWPDCPYDLVLNTENENYECDFLDVRTICSGADKTWSARVINCLNQIDTEYVFFFLEDQFLREPVNTEWVNKTINFMENNKDVGVIFVRHTGKQKEEYEDEYFPRDYVTEKFRIVGLAALYRKEYFLKILREHENPWEFERYASIRSKRYPEKVLQYNKECPAMFVFDDEIEKGYGITQRKWLPRNKELFEKYDIEVNFENLGWYEEIRKEPQQAVHNENLGFREFLYKIKKKLKKIPKNREAKHRREMSLK